MTDQRIKVNYSRLFAVGNFEHMKIGLEIESSKEDLGKDFQNLVATTIALKENGLELERKYTYEENARKRIKELQSELAGLQAQLPVDEKDISSATVDQ